MAWRFAGGHDTEQARQMTKLGTITSRGTVRLERITDPADASDFAAGWHFHLDTLESVVFGTQPPTDRLTWDDLHAQYVKAIPAHRA